MYTKAAKDKIWSRKQLGAYGEQFATKYLSDTLGWTIQERNWRCRCGEIDIVGLIRDELVFVEVRTKQANGRFGTALESVDARKLYQIQRVARIYASILPTCFFEYSFRFDLIALQVSGDMIIDFCHHRNITC